MSDATREVPYELQGVPEQNRLAEMGMPKPETMTDQPYYMKGGIYG